MSGELPSGLPVPRSRDDSSIGGGIQCADVLRVANENKVGFVFWLVEVKYADDCILTTSHCIT